LTGTSGIIARMMKLAWIPVGFAICVFCSERAFPWAQEGHAAIAAIAESLISPATQTKVQALLAKGGDQDLVSIASWADQVIIAAHDEGPLRGNQEAIEFNKKFPKSGMWHFVNLPLGATSYEQVRQFLSPDDVIQAISHCIQVLESPDPEPESFTKVQALRLLVHFVGDIHQPLHCGTGFYSFSDGNVPHLITAPTEAVGKPSDRGGNLLFYGPNATEQLHALWDRVLVERIDNSIDYRALADFLAKSYLPKEMVQTSGDYHQWAQVWAIESVQIAAFAYRGITFGLAEFDAGQHLMRINITLPTNYLDNNRGYAAQQLARAGVRLAQLLDTLKWQ
jgi:S1/P1 Nuclease